MTTLTEIIKRLNQRIEVSNIFDRIFGLCETNPKGKGFVHYNGNGQAQIVTDYDAKRGTIFWIKRGDVTTSEDSALKISGCKKMYKTAFPLTAYCVVLKSHLPCDNSESEDWIGGQVNRFLAGMDNGFKASLGVASYEVVPNKYSVTTKDLPENLEWACLTVDFTVNITTDSAANCYDLCTSEPIPLPPAFEPCQPCLTSVSVDGVTIVGNGTPDDPLVALGGGGGGSLRIQNEGTTITNAATNIDFIGNIVTASLAGTGDVDVTINQVQSDWNASSGLGEVLNKPTSLPPSGTAGGDLTGTYPNPTVHRVHGVDFQNGTPSADDVWVYGGTPNKWQHQKLHASQVTNDSSVTGTNVDDALEHLDSSKQPSLGFTPENVANKSTDVATDQASNTKYPSVKAVFDWASSVFTTASAVATQITTALTGYATEAWVTSQGFLTSITSGQVTTALGYTPVTNARTITINGTTQDLSADRTFTVGASVWKTTADTAGYSSAANTAVYTQLISANTFTIGDLIRVTYRTKKTGTTNSQTLRIYVNGTANLSGSPILIGTFTVASATGFYNQMIRHLAIKNSTTATEIMAATSASSGNDYINLATAVTIASIDWTANRYFIFAIQSGGATDVNYGSFYLIEKL